MLVSCSSPRLHCRCCQLAYWPVCPSGRLPPQHSPAADGRTHRSCPLWVTPAAPASSSQDSMLWLMCVPCEVINSYGSSHRLPTAAHTDTDTGSGMECSQRFNPLCTLGIAAGLARPLTCSSPLLGTVPPEGRKAVTPTVVAGHTTDPQVSLPMANGSSPAAATVSVCWATHTSSGLYSDNNVISAAAQLQIKAWVAFVALLQGVHSFKAR